MKVPRPWRVTAWVALAFAIQLGAGCNSGSSTSATSTSTTATTTTLAASSTAVTAGASVTLTATVSSTAATGTVTFYNGSTALGTGTVSSGTATLTTSFASAGSYSITAVYGGDSSYAASTSSAVTLTVTAASKTATTTTLSSSAATTTTGTTITLTATVSATAATGTVSFYNGTTALGTGTVSSGTATLTTSFASAGSYSLTAVYGGDTAYAGSTSSALTETVTTSSGAGNTTTTTLAASSTTAYPGSLVLLTATVSNTAATGTVSFYAGSSLLGSAALTTGAATLATHFTSTGTYTLTAVYGGDATYAASTSSAVTETVASGSYSLDLGNYTASTGSGTYNSVSVSYKKYSNVVYAANPVSTTYESMNIFIPTTVGGAAVSGMPVMLEIGVGGYMSSAAGSSPSTNGQYALSKGYVVVEAGCRGRDNGSSGNYYGVAPAAMVDLKAAVRYLRYNAVTGAFTGDVDHIIDSGGSAGGALATLLGASGNSELYNGYLAAIGAADAKDNIFAVGAWSPITNLDNADGAYEMEYGSLGSVNATISSALVSVFNDYQDGLALTDKKGSGYGTLAHSNISDFILVNYLEPSLEKYVKNGGTAPGYATCTASSARTYGYACTFTFANYVATSVGSRGKGVPAFDSFFDSSVSYSSVNTSYSAEVIEFGSPTGSASSYSSNARHFTDFSLQKTTGDSMKSVASDLKTIVNMMNPMYFITRAIASGDASGVAKYWYIRDGAAATDTSIYVIMDLATAVENLRGTGYVDAFEDWATGHNVNTDASGFSAWVTASVASN